MIQNPALHKLLIGFQTLSLVQELFIFFRCRDFSLWQLRRILHCPNYPYSSVSIASSPISFLLSSSRIVNIYGCRDVAAVHPDFSLWFSGITNRRCLVILHFWSADSHHDFRDWMMHVFIYCWESGQMIHIWIMWCIFPYISITNRFRHFEQHKQGLTQEPRALLTYVT